MGVQSTLSEKTCSPKRLTTDMIDVLQPLKIGYRHISRIQIQVLHGHNIKHLSSNHASGANINYDKQTQVRALYPNLFQIALAVSF